MTAMTADRAFIRAIRTGLRNAAVPDDAGPMQAYMKSELPFWGVKKPTRARMSKAVIVARPLSDFSSWHDTAEALFVEAKRREERYCALDLVGHRRYREHRDSWASFALYDRFVVLGAWWDIVDEVATQHIGALFQTERKRVSKTMRAWITDADMWRRRAAIICQNKRKAATDETLLFDAIMGAIDSKEFFLRKAIGWALREYGKTAPARVQAFVAAHEHELSGLSKREALRRLDA
jgi:3-methyladenine DNA glycosylase AlkD